MACTTGPQSVVMPAIVDDVDVRGLELVAAAFGSVDGAMTAMVSVGALGAAWNAFDSPLPDAVWFSAMPTLAPFGNFCLIRPTSYWASASPDGRNCTVHGYW